MFDVTANTVAHTGEYISELSVLHVKEWQDQTPLFMNHPLIYGKHRNLKRYRNYNRVTKTLTSQSDSCGFEYGSATYYLCVIGKIIKLLKLHFLI